MKTAIATFLSILLATLSKAQSCTDTPDWVDSYGDGCEWYEDNDNIVSGTCMQSHDDKYNTYVSTLHLKRAALYTGTTTMAEWGFPMTTAATALAPAHPQ